MIPTRPRNYLPPGNRACSPAGDTPRLSWSTPPRPPYRPPDHRRQHRPLPQGQGHGLRRRSRPAQPGDPAAEATAWPARAWDTGTRPSKHGSVRSAARPTPLFTAELEYEQEQRARIAHQPPPIALAAGTSPRMRGAPSRSDRYLPLSSRCPRDDHGLPF